MSEQVYERRRKEYDESANDLFACRECNKQKRGKDFYFNKYRSCGRRLRRCKECESHRFKRIKEAAKVRAKKERAAIEEAEDFGPHPRSKVLQPEKDRRRAIGKLIHFAIKAGMIAKSDHCERCGLVPGDDRQIHAHHSVRRECLKTVEEALDIEWLCRHCHREEHVEEFRLWGKKGREEAVLRGIK